VLTAMSGELDRSSRRNYACAASLSDGFPKKEKKEIQKRKSLARKIGKTPLKKMSAAGDTALTAWIDRSLVAFG
jgi:hypothetical protein